MELVYDKKKVYIFAGIDKKSRVGVFYGYRSKSSKNGGDFLRKLKEIFGDRLKYVQVDNGSEFKGKFEEEAKRLGVTKVVNYVRSPKMNCYVEKVIGTLQRL